MLLVKDKKLVSETVCKEKGGYKLIKEYIKTMNGGLIKSYSGVLMFSATREILRGRTCIGYVPEIYKPSDGVFTDFRNMRHTIDPRLEITETILDEIFVVTLEKMLVDNNLMNFLDETSKKPEVEVKTKEEEKPEVEVKTKEEEKPEVEVKTKPIEKKGKAKPKAGGKATKK